VHVFLDNKNANEGLLRNYSPKMFEKLQSMGAKNMKDQYLHSKDDRGGDKIRYNFIIDTQTEA